MLEPRNGEPGTVRLDDEGRHPPVPPLGLGVRDREDDQQVGDAGVADEPLRAIDDVLVAIADGARRVGRWIRAGGSLGQGERDELPPGREVGQPALLLFVRPDQHDRRGRQRVDREDQPGRRTGPAQLLDRETEGQQVRTHAAVFLREREAEHVLGREEILDVPRELAAAIDVRGPWRDLLVGQDADGIPDQDLIFGQPKRGTRIGHGRMLAARLRLPADRVPGPRSWRSRSLDQAAVADRSGRRSPRRSPSRRRPRHRGRAPRGRRGRPAERGPRRRAVSRTSRAGRTSWGSGTCGRRGASIAAWRSISKSTTFRKNWSVHWSCWSPPGVPKAMCGRPSRVTSDGVSVVRGRLPGARALGWPGVRLNTCAREPSGKPSAGITGDDSSQPPLGVAAKRFPSASATSTWVVSPLPARGSGGTVTSGAASASPGRNSADATSGSIRRRRSAAYSARQQPVQRHVHELGIAVAALAVGEGQLGRLDERVDVVGAVVAERAAGRIPRAVGAAGGRPGPASTGRTCGRRGRDSRTVTGVSSRDRYAARSSASIRPRWARPVASTHLRRGGECGDLLGHEAAVEGVARGLQTRGPVPATPQLGDLRVDDPPKRRRPGGLLETPADRRAPHPCGGTPRRSSGTRRGTGRREGGATAGAPGTWRTLRPPGPRPGRASRAGRAGRTARSATTHASNVAGTVEARSPSPGIASIPWERNHSIVARRGAVPCPLIATGFGRPDRRSGGRSGSGTRRRCRSSAA